MENYENEMNEDNMTYVEYIKQHDQSFIDEYNEYCKFRGLDPDDEESALAYIESTEDELDANMEN